MSAIKLPAAGAPRDRRAPSPLASVIRPMREGDLRGVLAVERGAYQFPWTEGVFRDCLRVGYSCWVAARAGVPVAHGILSVAAGEAHLLNLCVAHGLQRRGVGRALLEHLLQVARQHGAVETFLEVRPSNDVAMRLYEGAGFRRVGFRKDYYPHPDGREDAVVMAIDMAPFARTFRPHGG